VIALLVAQSSGFRPIWRMRSRAILIRPSLPIHGYLRLSSFHPGFLIWLTRLPAAMTEAGRIVPVFARSLDSAGLRFTHSHLER